MTDSHEYVIATFEPVDIEYRTEPTVYWYLEENGLTDSVTLEAVRLLRDWYDEACGDMVYENMRCALRNIIGSEKLKELES